MPVVDAHQHFWDLSLFRYEWMSPDNAVLYRTYLPDDLKPLMDAAAVDRCVFVQATQDVREARWVMELAQAHPFIAGVVGWVDLTAPDVGATLDDLMTNPLFKGVRHLVQDEPDDRWLLREDVNRGVAELVRRDLAYDILVFPRHLPHVPALLEQHPGGRFVVDHLAKPPIKSGEIDSWAASMEKVAAFPNVHCKLSGMVTEADADHWTPDDLRPYVQTVRDLFGPQRLMFGSDWPVCLLAAEYVEVKDALLTALNPIEPADLDRIMGGTATEFYKL
jgi:L-fuconolactonase